MKKTVVLIMTITMVGWAANPADLTNLYRVSDPGAGIGVDFDIENPGFNGIWGFLGAADSAKTLSGYLFLSGGGATAVGSVAPHQNVSLALETFVGHEFVANTILVDAHKSNGWGVGASVPFNMTHEGQEVKISPRVMVLNGKLKICATTNLEAENVILGASFYGRSVTIEVACQPSTDDVWIRGSGPVGGACLEGRLGFVSGGASATLALYF